VRVSVPLAALRERLPGLVGHRLVPIADGRDSEVVVVDGRWVVRAPRRPEVAARMRAEVALLAELARALPVAVPDGDPRGVAADLGPERLLGPWHEVTCGLDRARPAHVESSLAGVRERLR
jgi:aminoglycoside phosphotransferase (APT) family kinase protein